MTRPDNVRFAESHEWARLEDGVLTLGISDHAVEALGDIVFIDLPDVGATVASVEAAAARYEDVEAKPFSFEGARHQFTEVHLVGETAGVPTDLFATLPGVLRVVRVSSR